MGLLATCMIAPADTSSTSVFLHINIQTYKVVFTWRLFFFTAAYIIPIPIKNGYNTENRNKYDFM